MRRQVVTDPPDTRAPRRFLVPRPRRSTEGALPAARRRYVRRGLSVTGFGLSAAFYCLSFTPSLLPRPWYLQGIVAGLTAAIGYALGTAIGALVRLRWWPSRRAEQVAWRILFALVPILVLVFLILGARWQRELRLRLGMEPQQQIDLARTVGISLLTFGALLLLARLLRLATHGTAKLFCRVVPEPAAYCAGFVVVTMLSYTAVDGLLVERLYDTADRSAEVTDSGTGRGVTRPGSPLRSGGPESLISWDSLGRQGRNFVARAPSRPELTGFAGRAAEEPIRLYAGLSSAPTPQARPVWWCARWTARVPSTGRWWRC